MGGAVGRLSVTVPLSAVLGACAGPEPRAPRTAEPSPSGDTGLEERIFATGAPPRELARHEMLERNETMAASLEAVLADGRGGRRT